MKVSENWEKYMEGICNGITVIKTVNVLRRGGYSEPEQLLYLSMDELQYIEGLSDSKAIKMYRKNFRIRNQGEIFRIS